MLQSSNAVIINESLENPIFLLFVDNLSIDIIMGYLHRRHEVGACAPPWLIKKNKIEKK